MKLIQVGAAVLNQTPLDWNGNQRRIVEVLKAAREQGVSILCLPRTSFTLYYRRGGSNDQPSGTK